MKWKEKGKEEGIRKQRVMKHTWKKCLKNKGVEQSRRLEESRGGTKCVYLRGSYDLYVQQ
jgi:hypothetical protein